MTDRHAGYIVTLRQPVREDDDEAIVTALRMVSGVLSVTPVVDGIDRVMAEQRAVHTIGQECLDAVHEIVRKHR